MKFLYDEPHHQHDQSPPLRGAWIEICAKMLKKEGRHESPPSQGAWIEIPHCPGYGLRLSVAPLAGGVD